jgi:hypothetical protein
MFTRWAGGLVSSWGVGVVFKLVKGAELRKGVGAVVSMGAAWVVCRSMGVDEQGRFD